MGNQELSQEQVDETYRSLGILDTATREALQVAGGGQRPTTVQFLYSNSSVPGTTPVGNVFETSVRASA